MKVEKCIVVVGAGSWGGNHIRNFFNNGTLYGVYDIKKEKRDEVSLNYPDIKIFENYEDVLSDGNVKGIVIATLSSTHYELTKKALLSGKDVLCEKPLSINYTEGEELVKLAEKNKRILMVGHIMEYHPAVKKIEGMIEKGELGKILYLYSNRLNLGKVRKEENILWSFAPHDIAIILRLLKEEPFEISSKPAYYLNPCVADVTLTFLSFSSGVRGHIFVSWLHPYKEQRLVVIGEKGMIVFNDTSQREKLIFYKHNFKWMDRLAVAVPSEGEIVEIEDIEPMKIQTEDFIECIIKRKVPVSSGKEALKVLKILSLCEESLQRNGETIKIPQSNKKKNFFLHPSSYIDEDVEIGDGTKIWHFCHIMRGGKIGKFCIMGQGCFIGEGVEIGNRVKIENGVNIFKGVKIEDDVFLAPSVTFTNVRTPRSFIERKSEFENTIVRKGVTIGANSTIVCGVEIGEYSFIGAGSVVTKNIPPHSLFVGNPAKKVGWVCYCGKKLPISSEEERFEIKCSYCGKIVNVS